VVVSFDDAVDAPALRLTRVAVEWEAMAHAAVNEAAKTKSNKLLI
jgi:hypothetical protein